MDIANAYVQEARCEILRYLRNPGFLLPIILFPAAFYLMFGVALAEHSAPGAARYLLASYSTFGVMAPGLFGFGVSLALERDSGLLTLKRALPMPPGAYLLGKMLMAMVVAAVVGVLLLLLAVFLAGVELTAVKKILKLTVFVASTPDFSEHHLVANGASNLIVGVLGDKGKHSRAAFGVAALPLGAAVEIEAVVEVE